METENHDTNFLDELNNAPESEIPGFDKHLYDSRPGNISNFQRIDRHVKILPNYRIYLGRDVIFNIDCFCQNCIASKSNYIKRTRIFFRIQKGRVSKQSERVASVNFEHFNFSFNYMLSICLLRHPDKLDDINAIALQTNKKIQYEKNHNNIEDVNNLYSENTSLIIENLFDFKDLLLTYLIKEEKTKLFYAIDQFGNLWFNRSKEFEIWLSGIKLIEKGWIKLKVDTFIKSESFKAAEYFDYKLDESIPEKEVINKIELLDFSISKEFQKEKRKPLILKKLKKLKVKNLD